MKEELLRMLQSYVNQGYTWQQAMQQCMLQLRHIAFPNDGIYFQIAVEASEQAFDAEMFFEASLSK